MSEIFSLARLKVGQIGEIVELKEEELVTKWGIGKGMSVIVLQQAVDWLVQIGCNQLLLNKETLNKIHVKEANV